MAHILSRVERKVTEEMNQMLTGAYAKEEIFAHVKSMGPTKAAGNDSFLVIFYQQFWHIIGRDVCNFCLSIPSEGMRLESCNATNIMLIQKIAQPNNLSNFRPISLCSNLYKIISKTVANHFQKVLDCCIDEAQSAFVPGRLITNNILLAYEVLHTFKQKRVGGKGFLALKLDMSKVYYRVEWSFLRQMLLKMGFASLWVDSIMHCIDSISYSIVINGCEGEKFKPTMGLRQGGPLSPYIFLVCNEGLSTLMCLAERDGMVKRARVSRKDQRFLIYFFADDIIFFGEASNQGVQTLKKILQEYEEASNKYLGLPNMVGRGKVGVSRSKRSHEAENCQLEH
ncbi:reverse transcriptase [Gossypium australe]|uniref:Reverse transcriptase n=1 Tax=Gossypium australe TaxID=47621 RepID=A0A5B6WZC9_9ROSI|nr:reverse transcriptase [Gossypium australe]